jgi:TatD DNase family protein
MRFFDTHTHYCDPRFDSDRDAVLSSLEGAGVVGFIEMACEPSEFDPALALAQNQSGRYAALGIHPHNAKQASAQALALLEAKLQAPKVVALGELGLDYHYDFASPKEQQDCFVAQLALARRVALPLVLHIREAYADAFPLLHAHGLGLPGVMHCFTAGIDEARKSLDLGLYIAFGGALTFKKSEAIAEAAAYTPLDRLLLETDCPYMAPAPYRGQRNDSRNIPLIAKRLAELRGVSVERVAGATCENAQRLFGITI